VGSASMLADAETIAIINEILLKLGFYKFKIKINNRKILSGIVEYSGVNPELGTEVCIAIDKLEKIGVDGVIAELKQRNIAESAIGKILPILEISGDVATVLNDVSTVLKASSIGSEGVRETSELIEYLAAMAIAPENYLVDLHLARGLTYYTGPIFESVVEEPKIGSLTGGGRYDQLIGMFLGENIPATGTTLGIERIIDVMTELDMLPQTKTMTRVLVTIFDESTKQASIKLVQRLRQDGINSELYFESGGLKKQFKYADKSGIPFVIIMGPDEVEKNQASLKNMVSGEQQQLSVDQIVQLLKN
ncbi:MAG: HisS family protein, partial [bacterium]|nr:HisS family protein [bacterium]